MIMLTIHSLAVLFIMTTADNTVATPMAVPDCERSADDYLDVDKSEYIATMGIMLMGDGEGSGLDHGIGHGDGVGQYDGSRIR